MPGTLYQFGEFQFNLQDGAPDDLSRDLQWRWPSQGRILRKPALQFMGPGSDRITLAGVLYPGSTGRQSTIDQLRQIGDLGEPQMLVDGLGRVYGRYALIGIQETRSVLMDNGAARKIEFDVTLLEYGEDTDEAFPGVNQAVNPTFLNQVMEGMESINFNGDGSGFDLSSWTSLPGFQVDLSTLDAAGFSIPQATVIGQAVGDPAQVLPSLEPFGVGAPLSQSRREAWEAAGISPEALVQAMQDGYGAPATSVGLDALQVGGTDIITELGGTAFPGVSSMVNQAGTLSPILNVDPAITSGIRSALSLF